MIDISEIFLLKCEKLSNKFNCPVDETAAENEGENYFRFFYELLFFDVHFFLYFFRFWKYLFLLHIIHNSCWNLSFLLSAESDFIQVVSNHIFLQFTVAFNFSHVLFLKFYLLFFLNFLQLLFFLLHFLHIFLLVHWNVEVYWWVFHWQNFLTFSRIKLSKIFIDRFIWDHEGTITAPLDNDRFVQFGLTFIASGEQGWHFNLLKWRKRLNF